MEVDRRRKRQKSVNDEKHNNRRHYQRSDMKGRLMYSEWLIDIPEDLENEWLMIAIPTGKRVLVLAENVRVVIMKTIPVVIMKTILFKVKSRPSSALGY